MCSWDEVCPSTSVTRTTHGLSCVYLSRCVMSQPLHSVHTTAHLLALFFSAGPDRAMASLRLLCYLPGIFVFSSLIFFFPSGLSSDLTPSDKYFPIITGHLSCPYNMPHCTLGSPIPIHLHSMIVVHYFVIAVSPSTCTMIH